MAKFQLQENKILIGSGSMAYYEPEWNFRICLWNGHIYITNQTNQRAVFGISLTGICMMELRMTGTFIMFRWVQSGIDVMTHSK